MGFSRNSACRDRFVVDPHKVPLFQILSISEAVPLYVFRVTAIAYLEGVVRSEENLVSEFSIYLAEILDKVKSFVIG
jgi:hypothetical protein